MIRKILIARTDDTLVQLFRYLIVGGVAFLADIGGLYVLTEFAGFHYLISAAISFIMGWIINYRLSIIWIFQHSKLNNRVIEFFLFGLIGLVGLGLNGLLIWLLTESAGVYYLVSKIIAAIFVFMWNFAARKYGLFG